MADQEEEHQRETEGLLDIIRELRKELLLDTLLIDSFIPPEFQVSILLVISPLTSVDSLCPSSLSYQQKYHHPIPFVENLKGIWATVYATTKGCFTLPFSGLATSHINFL